MSWSPSSKGDTYSLLQANLSRLEQHVPGTIIQVKDRSQSPVQQYSAILAGQYSWVYLSLDGDKLPNGVIKVTIDRNGNYPHLIVSFVRRAEEANSTVILERAQRHVNEQLPIDMRDISFDSSHFAEWCFDGKRPTQGFCSPWVNGSSNGTPADKLANLLHLGDLIERSSELIVYSHWDVVVELNGLDSVVIGYFGSASPSSSNNTADVSGPDDNILRSHFAQRKWRIHNKHDGKCSPKPEEAIIAKARRAIETANSNYSATGYNCEHFAFDCRYDNPNLADQARNTGSLLMIIALAIAAVKSKF